MTTITKLLGPGGAKAVVADNLLMKQQFLVINRARRLAPNLLALDRFLFGFWSWFFDPRRIQHTGVLPHLFERIDPAEEAPTDELLNCG